ncbi:hypothetical protein RIE95_01225 [Acidithiobacillus thiooxidans]|uniref:hypothetical protein n=1 Tax=Acidithiobacillus thiooxidans TaxID=930 RepID=UPI00285FA1D4|nr:hypothetical protein [Acidithiobacillus thiooxidans]MDR7925631.1 hypothetical protein [Acidithiobacillus thiooxidans]
MLALIGGPLVAQPAAGHVFLHSTAACDYLKEHAITNQSIRRVAHIPEAPYLTAIVGKKAECVAAAPAWFKNLTSAEQSWLWLVGIAGLRHPHIYHLMLHAAEHPPQGLFAGVEKWYGHHVANRSILKSEKQATLWLPNQNHRVALKTLEKLAQDRSFSENSRATQHKATTACFMGWFFYKHRNI